MWNKVTEIAQSAAAMLQTGKTPPNTPANLKDQLESVNFLTSKKFFVVFCSVIILTLFYAASIFVLFLTANAPSLTVPFVTIFTETVKILAVIIASYLGVQTVLDFKYNSSTTTDLNYSRQDSNDTITLIQTNAKEDDYELD